MKYSEMRYPFNEREAVNILNSTLGGVSAIYRKDRFAEHDGTVAMYDIEAVRNVRIWPASLGTSCGDGSIDAESLTRWPEASIQAELIDITDESECVRRKLTELADHMAYLKAREQVIDAVRQYRAWTPPSFSREWKEETRQDGKLIVWTISNLVYEMQARMDLQCGTVRCSYTIQTRIVQPGITPDAVYVKRVLDKRFAKEEAGRAYLDARRKQYEKKYFSEDCPPLPSEIAFCFTWAGMLLPGYRFEGEKLPHCFLRENDGKPGVCEGRACAVCTDCPFKREEKA